MMELFGCLWLNLRILLLISASGKTHTIMGSADAPGIVPRAINRIFESLELNVRLLELRLSIIMTQVQARGTASVYLTVADLYNDTFVDLLETPSCSTRQSAMPPNSNAAAGFSSPRSSRRGSISSIASPRPIVYSAPNIRKHVSLKTTATGVTLQGDRRCDSC
jgi:hypothetical protein